MMELYEDDFRLDTDRCFCDNCIGCDDYSHCIRGVCVCFDQMLDLPNRRCHGSYHSESKNN